MSTTFLLTAHSYLLTVPLIRSLVSFHQNGSIKELVHPSPSNLPAHVEMWGFLALWHIEVWKKKCELGRQAIALLCQLGNLASMTMWASPTYRVYCNVSSCMPAPSNRAAVPSNVEDACAMDCLPPMPLLNELPLASFDALVQCCSILASTLHPCPTSTNFLPSIFVTLNNL